jgi:hypothetical protein
MTSKTSVSLIIRDHYATFTDVRTNSARKLDYAVPVGAPLALGVVVVACNIRLQGVSDFIAGMAVFSALLFGLLLYIFQLRMQVSDDPRLSPRPRNGTLVDQLFANVAYAALVGVIATGLLIVASSLRHADTNGVLPPLDRWWSGLVTVACLHVLLTVAMCLKRTRTAYLELTR